MNAMPPNVVIVESPAKAKTINKYLGSDFVVLASFGHVRDLPPRDGSVRPDEDFALDWEVDGKADQRLKDMARAVKGARRLYLATDPDREGEAISWHVWDELTRRRALKDVEVHRVTFNAITKSAVTEAMAAPRQIDKEMVDAYLARRALDYLVGFTLSPILWRKLPGSKSAGRVQSVALRLICEREADIERFKSQEYWTVDADLTNVEGTPFVARLTHLAGRKIDRLGLVTQAQAEVAKAAIEEALLAVRSIDRKTVKRHPSPPFTTSTLQQEASRKLYFSATRTMSVAQKLYEGVSVHGETVGLITYMRTDGVQMAGEAIAATRSLIKETFGAKLVPEAPRVYKTKAKNAQEAHEAIRPTNVFLKPADVRTALSDEQFKLYELIWKRTVASQMESALLDQMAVDVGDATGQVMLRANGSAVVFEGFLKLYREDLDDSSDDDEGASRLLPLLKEGERTPLNAVRSTQHFTQPPPRYGEASLVKRMEELGIGRPSTYASVMQVLQDRAYVRLDARRLIPEDRGRIVTAFLESFFKKYVEYSFTADLETQLDDISGGTLAWKDVLRAFWGDFSSHIEGTRQLRITEVIDALDADLAPHLFPERPDGTDPRGCPSCGAGRLSLKLGKYGAFIGCSNYPECRLTRPLGGVPGGEDRADGGPEDVDRDLGHDPVSGQPVILKKGPYGWYVQLGGVAPPVAPLVVADQDNQPDAPAAPAAKGKTRKPKAAAAAKPKRTGLPKGMEPSSVDLDKALRLLSLPREVGIHPESQTAITASIGPYGPYIKHGSVYVNLRDDDVLDIGINRAVSLLAEAPERKGKAGGRALGAHPEDGKPLSIGSGRFGPYVQHGKIYATIPKDMDKDALTLEEAVALIAAKVAKAGTVSKPSKAKSAAKESATKKAPAKKLAAKKPPAKKTAAKKPAVKSPKTTVQA